MADEFVALPETLSHRLAILSMDWYAMILSEISGIPMLVGDLSDSEDAGKHDKPKVKILLPSTYVFDKLHLPDESWKTTSDTIAAVLASSVGASLIKVTDVDGILVEGTLLKEVFATELERRLQGG